MNNQFQLSQPSTSLFYMMDCFFYGWLIMAVIQNNLLLAIINQMTESKKVVVATNYTSSRINQQDPNNFIQNQYRQASNSLAQRHGNVRYTSSKIMTSQYEMNQGGSKAIISHNRLNGSEAQAIIRGNLEWDDQHKLVISGETDFSTLKHTKELLMNLLSEFNGKNKVVFEGDYKEDYSKRLLLLEHQLEGTMRRVLNVSQSDPSGGKRSLDYTRLLNQKQNQLNDRERKLSNYEERLRAAQQRMINLELQIQNLNTIINQRNEQVKQIRRILQYKSLALDKIKSNPNLYRIQQITDIFIYINSQENQGGKNQISNYVSQLQREIGKLKGREMNLKELDFGVESWILGLPVQSILRAKLEQGERRLNQDGQFRTFMDKFAVASELYKKQLQTIQRQNPGIKIPYNTQILQILRSSNSKATIINGYVEIQKQVKVTKEVTVQDAKTKSLICALSTHMRRLHDKYPKLKGEIDERLLQFLTIEMSDMIEIDTIDRIVDIVKYVPQIVKVQNVYTYNSEKNRKVQFHLRVLIKALLQQMQKVKRQKGIVFQIDEGVIGMIRAQIMDVIQVDDILKVYRAVPKIVQIPRIIEKVVDNIVRVPEKYQTNQYQSQAIPLQKPLMAIDQKALIVQSQIPVPFFRQKPVQVISHTEKVVSYPQLNERVAIQVRQKIKLQPENVAVQKIVQVQKAIIVQKDKIVIQKELQQIQIIKEVVRYIQTEKQIPKIVQIIVQKIVQKIIEKEKVVLVPQIIEKIVQVIRYETITEQVPHIQTRIQIVKEIVEKIVTVTNIEERIVQVPQIIQKIVTVEKIIERPPRQIQVIKEILKIVERIQIIEVEVPKIIYETRVEIRQVQKFIEIPIIVPQIKIETEIHQVPFIETIQSVQHVPVEVIKHVVLKEEVPVEVIKNVPYIMKEEVPIMVKEEKVITQELYYERIKEVPTTKQKIIEKIVEVPKCVEIQRIVQKIVIVPRIVEKIVLVPQIIEKIVQKIIQIPIQMPPTEHKIPYQIIIDRPIQVQRQKIVYITVDKHVQIPGDQILVKDLQTKTIIQVEKCIVQRVAIERQQVPVQLHVDKIITVPFQKREVQIIEKVIYRPIQVPVPVILEKTLPVYINTETVHVQPVPQLVQKIVEKTNIKRQPQIIPQIQQKVVIEQKYQFKQIERIVIEKQIQQVQRFEEKIVVINTTIEQIKEVPFYIEKLIPIIQEIPKIYQYEKEAKVVFTPPTIEIVDRIVPKIINVNKYIERLVEKLIEVPHLLREVEIVKEHHEKNIPGPERVNTTLKTVNLEIEKELIRQKEKIIQTKVSFIEETLKTVTQIMDRQRDPVIITRDRIIEIPIVLEKIVQKVIIMPQIVEVLKYVNQIIENDGINIGLDVSVEAQEYKLIGQDLERGFGQFLSQLNKVKALQPSSAQRIILLEQYLAKFRRFIKYPKIHEIIKEKVVEKDRIVKIPSQKSSTEIKQELAKVLLIEKLIAQISRIKRTHPQVSLQLQDDINFIFRLGFEGKVKDINSKLTLQLKEFQNSLDRKFSKMGGWSKDHQLMLKSFLQERFVLANIVKGSNQEIKFSKKQNQELITDNLRLKNSLQEIMGALVQNKNIMPGVLSTLSKQKDGSLSMAYTLLIRRFDDVINSYNSYQKEDFQPTRYLGKRFIEEMIESSLREKQKEIEILKSKLISRVGGDHQQCKAIIQGLQHENNRLNNQVTDFSVNGTLNGKNTRFLEQQIDKLTRQLKETSTISKSNDSKKFQTQISRLNLLIQQGNNHSKCLSFQKGLQSENYNIKQEIQTLIIKLQSAQRQLIMLRERERDIQSPKRTMITNNSNSPREQGKRSIVISHVERASQDYGENFNEYINNDGLNIGTLQHQSYRSGIMQGRDLSGSSATYRSGQVITSTQYIKNPNTIVESAKYLNEQDGTQLSSSTVGVSGVKKYNYYQKRYEGSN